MTTSDLQTRLLQQLGTLQQFTVERVACATISTTTRLRKLLSGLADKTYRSLFVETQIETVIPFQIRAMRAHRGWTQKELAERAGMAQGRISLLESVNYEGAVNVKTLVKLADAFDVGLIVRFAPFSEVAEWSTGLSREDHDVPDFASEMARLEADEAEMTFYTTEVSASQSITATAVTAVSPERYALAA